MDAGRLLRSRRGSTLIARRCGGASSQVHARRRRPPRVESERKAARKVTPKQAAMRLNGTEVLATVSSPRTRLCENSSLGLFAIFTVSSARRYCPVIASRRAGFEGLDQAVGAENLDCSLDVVAQDPQGPFAVGFLQPADKKARMAHHPFHRPEWVFGEAAPQSHPSRRAGGSVMHRLTGVFVKAAHDRASVRRRA